jgi:chromosome segregation ATPase
MTKVSQLTENHNNTKDELYDVEDFIFDLAKDLQNLKDSVKHIEEEMHHSDDDIVASTDDGQYDEASDYPITPSHDMPSTTEDIQRAEREEYYEDDMGWVEDIPIPSY